MTGANLDRLLEACRDAEADHVSAYEHRLRVIALGEEARTAIPALVAEVRRLRAQLALLEGPAAPHDTGDDVADLHFRTVFPPKEADRE